LTGHRAGAKLFSAIYRRRANPYVATTAGEILIVQSRLNGDDAALIYECTPMPPIIRSIRIVRMH